MKLIELSPQFRRYLENGNLGKTDSIHEAQGLTFECPKCISRHWILIWFYGRGVPDGVAPKPRWKVSGMEYGDISIDPSINADTDPQRPCWHGFITNGEVK